MLCTISYGDNCPVFCVNHDSHQNVNRPCLYQFDGGWYKFIIILALLSHLALVAEFNLIGDLHKVMTVCHILKQW